MKRSLLFAFALASAACGDDAASPVEPQPDGGTPDMMPDGDVPPARAHAGGAPSAIVIAGTHAYVAVGPRLAIWDIAADPPALLGESAPLPGVIGAVTVAGARAYVAETIDLTSTIHILDVTAAAPVEVASFALAAPSEIRDLIATPTRLYVADRERGVVELDLANPLAPAELRTAAHIGVTDLTLVGSRLYYTLASSFGGASAGALDLDNDLADLGWSPLGSAEGVAFAGTLAISAGPDGIFVHDLADPSNAVERYHYFESDGGPYARAIAAYGTTAWVPATSGMYIFDLANPSDIRHSAPRPLDTAGTTATAASAVALAIVTDRGRLLALDVTQPTQPGAPRIADVTLCADCVGVTAAGGTAYVADIVGGLRTASLAELAALGRSPALPAMPGGLQLVFEDVAVAGQFAYVADWLFGLRIYDVTDASTPQLVGALATGGAPSGIAVEGDRAYVAEGTNGGMLRVIDVADPAHPVQLGAVATTKAMKVVVRNKIAYVADESLFGPGGLRIFDVSNPAQIAQLAYYNTDCMSAGDVALLGNEVIVACQADGFHWLDISNPAAPMRIAVMHLAPQNGSARAVAAWQGHYALGHDRGVLVIDEHVQTVATYATSHAVRSLAVPSPGHIVAACGPGGVYQWQP